MKLNDFLDEMIAKDENCPKDELEKRFDLKAKRNSKFKSLSDRLSLLFWNFSENVKEGNRAFEDDFIDLEERNKRVEKENSILQERDLVISVMLLVVELFKTSHTAEEAIFITNYIKEVECLFDYICINHYTTDISRRNAITSCINKYKDKFPEIHYKVYMEKIHQDGRIGICDFEDATYAEIQGIVQHNEKLWNFYTKFINVLRYYNNKENFLTAKGLYVPGKGQNLLRITDANESEELIEAECELFNYLFEIIPLIEKGNGTKDLMKRLRKKHWDILSAEKRKLLFEKIMKLYQTSSTTRFKRYILCEDAEDTQKALVDIYFMLDDPLRFRLIQQLQQLCLFVKEAEFEETYVPPETLLHLEEVLEPAFALHENETVRILNEFENMMKQEKEKLEIYGSSLNKHFFEIEKEINIQKKRKRRSKK